MRLNIATGIEDHEAVTEEQRSVQRPERGTFRIHRQVANLLLDTVHVAYAELGQARRFLKDVSLDEPLEAPAPGDVPADVDEVLARAVRAGAITAAAAALIGETEIEGVSLHEVANRLGVT